ncbi:glucose/galactose transporter [Neokomagataea thailandica NBRC 106555]|uniref:Glucose/galactose MFS transporter n=2 Tax=Neokomagataea TaxID=1223423 RepID=A0A4Y6V8J8_9PROT|nr:MULTISPECIES: glucose/galactose MFS transporter [Neokomagataea]QDH25198.1 glucose/galactose MFS transporter [Neokomagataea tanensis]GBR53428.1 glucose/galactose transporter [Neokomagataea thailandica NBRC 106555]
MTNMSLQPKAPLWPLGLMALLFFVVGFVTWANGPLITFVQIAFHISDFRAFLVPAAFYLSYVVFALPASWVAERCGMKRGMVLALLIMAQGILTFARFISWQVYDAALVGLFILGAGLALLQVTINPYVSLLGAPERAAQRIAIMGICNKFAGILAPLVLGTLVMHDISHVSAELSQDISPDHRHAIIAHFTYGLFGPYLGLAGLLVLTALVVARAPLPELQASRKEGASIEKDTKKLSGRVLFGAMALFMYVGVEVMAGDAIGTYGRSFGLPIDQTKFLTSATLASMLLGYISGIIVSPRFLAQEVYMVMTCALGTVLALSAWMTGGYTSVLLVAFLGFANAMIWPTLFPLAIRNSGSAAAFASSVLIMAICGGALLPQAWILLSHSIGFQAAFSLIALVAYGVIGSYGFYWHKQDKKSSG